MTNFTTNMTEQYVQNLYQKNAESAKAAYQKQNGKGNTEKVRSEKEEAAAVYEGSVTQPGKAVTYKKPVSVGENKKNDLQAKLGTTYEKLSAEAKEYLEELKAKFGDIDFFVADCASDEEMQRYFEMGTKKYSCVISSATLEQMAIDETARAKYEGIIDGADEKIEEAKQQVKEEFGEEAAEQIESFGISIDDQGVVTYFAKLKEANEEYYLHLKEKREEAKAKAEEEERKVKEHRHDVKNETPVQDKETAEKTENDSLWVKADSLEALVEALRSRLEQEA